MMRFREYVAARRITDSANGDFCADARNDKRLPDVDTFGELRAYLIYQRQAPQEAVDAARAVWRGYEALKAKRAAKG